MNRPLRVLHVLTNLGGFGGIQEYVTNLVTTLDRDKFHVEVAVGPGDGPYLPRLLDAGIPVHRLSLVRPVRLWTDIKALMQLLRLLRTRRYDIVHTHMSKGGCVGRVAARICRVPLVVAGAYNFGVLYLKGTVGAPCFWLIDKLMVAGLTDMVISDSEQIRREVIRLRMIPAHKIRTVSSGIDLRRFAVEPEVISPEGRASASLIVGTIARLIPAKGLPELLQAAVEIIRVSPTVQFVIVGDGPERMTLERQIIDLGLSAHVSLLGSQPDILRLLYTFDVFVLSSRSEGRPVVLMEAMAAGRPIVATRVGGVGELLTHNESGLLVPPGSIKDLTQALLTLLQDSDRRRALGKAARQVAFQQLSLARMAASVEAIYLEHCSSMEMIDEGSGVRAEG
jgi:glycosyltransferase involved in cell wall biosynthesis